MSWLESEQEEMTMEHILSPDGTRIGYQKSGTGQPLVFVHGSTADHRRWSKLLPALEPHFTVYAMDRRGRGESGDAPEYSFQREAEDVAAVIATACQQTGQPAAVLGHSFGALCSLEAARLSGDIQQLILYEPPLPVGKPLYAADFPARMQSLIERGELEAALEMFLKEEVKMPEPELAVYRTLPQWPERVKIVHTLLREIVIDRTYRFDPAQFSGLQVPTLLLLGSDSPPIFREAVETLSAVLPNRQVVELPGQQHIAMDTAPELFLREVLGFLQETKRSYPRPTVENQTLLREWFAAVNTADLPRLDQLAGEIFTVDFMLHDPRLPDFEAGPVGVKKFIHQVLADNTDVRITIQDIFSQQDRTATRYTVSMTERASGKRVSAQLLSIDRFVDGKIAEEWQLSAPGQWEG
jgi:pimeloyl-ACP methyl ester carboxylesterase/ketosteroid isomerase-like protein